MDKSIRVNILDREYPLRVKAEEEVRAREVAERVEQRMQAIRRRLPAEPDLTVAVMAAMAIADDLYATQTIEAASHKAAISEIDTLIDSIASVVA
jgi:cell division protein ZapA